MDATFNNSLYGAGLHLIGVNHKTLPLHDREVLARSISDRNRFINALLQEPAIEEAAMLSTCNRLELLAVGCNASHHAAHLLKDNLKGAYRKGCIYELHNADAVRHFFRVSAGLDSMIIGECQILGQVKDAYREAVASRTVGPYLHRLFQYAFKVAKKTRTASGIGRHSVSLSYLAVQLARQILGALEGRSVMVIGAGKMGELAAIHLRAQGCRDLIVANRTVENARDLARRIGADAVALSDLEKWLEHVDAVIGSAASPRYLIEPHMLKRVRRSKPLFLIDLGMPPNFSPDLPEKDHVYLYTLDELADVIDRNRELREEAARDAEVIIEYGLQQFESWLKKWSAARAMRARRGIVEEACAAELQRGLR